MRIFFAILLACLLSGCTNLYESAQRSVGLVDSGHSYGSAFAVQRTNPSDHTRIFLWTAAHVVRGENSVKIRQIIRNENRKVGESSFSAVVIARDERLDLALLWLDAPTGYFEPVRFEMVAEHVGDPVYSCGNFGGPMLDGSISTGVISQFGVHINDWPWSEPLDQTTCIVQPGSSGGPLFDAIGGRVVGVVVGSIPGSGTVNFFVPVRTIRIFAELHKVSFAFSGVRCPSDAALRALEKVAHYDPPVPESPDPNKPIDADP